VKKQKTRIEILKGTISDLQQEVKILKTAQSKLEAIIKQKVRPVPKK